MHTINTITRQQLEDFFYNRPASLTLLELETRVNRAQGQDISTNHQILQSFIWSKLASFIPIHITRYTLMTGLAGYGLDLASQSLRATHPIDFLLEPGIAAFGMAMIHHAYSASPPRGEYREQFQRWKRILTLYGIVAKKVAFPSLPRVNVPTNYASPPPP